MLHASKMEVVLRGREVTLLPLTVEHVHALAEAASESREHYRFNPVPNGELERTRCNSEAKLLLLQHAFERWDVYRVTLRTDERNARSRAAILRLGASFEGIRRADSPGVDGTVRNSAFYSIVRDEWPRVREQLERRLGESSEHGQNI